MKIKSSTKDYEVIIHQSLSFIEELSVDENTMLVIDQTLYDLYRTHFEMLKPGKLVLLEAREENKTIEKALEICELMTEIPAKRNSKLVSFGGGIVQDVTGFVANILYRGVKWIFIPTTLLASCDSCIGGKTSLNYKQYKNLLGTFYPPDVIHICPEFFKTLSERDYQSGLGEVVKFNIMFGVRGLARIEEKMDRLLTREGETVNEFVENSLAFKKPYIEEDEFDRGVRIHLNFAHTFAHAFETISEYYIPHGTAVAIGTIVANRIALSRGNLDDELVCRSERVLKKIINIDLTEVDFDMDKIIQAIRKDKKQTSTDLTAVLMHDDFKLEIVHDVRPSEIQEAIDYTLKYLKG